jgi:serine/threonine-protein kinase
MNNNFLSFCAGKYEIIRTLGSGSYSTVYLVRHQVLELEQAIKVIPKARSDQLSVLSEARLLKSIHHPGIPMIYDMDEDDQYFYLIEEYIPGESLETFLLNQPIISMNLFFSICRQLCDIFIYLHTFLPIPVLYQDLKPEHIIVCQDQIKLIDFGASGYASNSGNNIKHFGNASFSAPENLAGSELSTSADVYSLGKLFQLLSKHVEPPLSQTFSKIIQKSIQSDPAFRYETVEALLSDLEKEFARLRSPHLVQNIAALFLPNPFQ